MLKNVLATVALSALLALSGQVFGADNSFVTTKPMSPLLRPVRYDNQMLLSVPKSKQFFVAADDLGLDVWSVGVDTVQVRADTKQQRALERRLRIKAKVLNSNIQRDIDRETAQLNEQIKVSKRFAVGDDQWHTQYHPLDDIINWYKAVADKYPQLVKFYKSAGKSVEGRDLPYIELTGTAAGPRKNIWHQHEIHAREWISAATGQYIVDKLTAGYGTDARITAVLDKVKFIIVPVVNPDGYVYTWGTDRLWRKNRGANAKGVDMNRNYPEHWGQGGSSSSPSSDTYMGPSAGSEPEVKALMALYKSYKEGMVGAIDFHSYSQLLLRPYGWTNNKSPDEAAFVQVGEAMKKDLAASRGTKYVSQPSIDLYVTTGTASDWFYGSNSTTAKGQFRSYGITIELPPSQFDWNMGGFELPPQYILPVGKETLPAILTYAEFCSSTPLTVN